MKKLFIAALLFVGIVSFAQENNTKPAREQREKLTPEQRNTKQLKKLTTELNLSVAQQEQVKQFIAEKSANAQKFKEARKDKNTKPTAEEKATFEKQMKADKEAADTKMKSILNADQYKKWSELKKEGRKRGDIRKGARNFKDRQDRDKDRLQKLTTELSLTADQQKQVGQVYADRKSKMAEYRKNKKDNTTKPTAEEKKAFEKQMKADKEATDAKMKTILNADQYKKWSEIQKEHKKEMRHHRRDKK